MPCSANSNARCVSKTALRNLALILSQTALAAVMAPVRPSVSVCASIFVAHLLVLVADEQAAAIARLVMRRLFATRAAPIITTTQAAHVPAAQIV